MKSFFKLLIICIFLGNNFAFAQVYSSQKKSSEIETLEKLNKIVESDKEKEFDAKKSVLNYRNEIRNEIRTASKYLTEEKYQQLISLENGSWKMATLNLELYGSYLKFYRNEIELLEAYKNSMLDSIERATR